MSGPAARLSFAVLAPAALAAGFVLAADPAPAGKLTVTARTRVDEPVVRKERQPDGTVVERQTVALMAVEQKRTLDPAKTAVVICDMWDDHWCASAARRCGVLAGKAGPVVEALRKQGATIVHCPSACMAFYADHPARKRTLALPPAAPPKDRELPDPPLPIDDSDGGCDDPPPAKFRKAWTRQHDAIRIDPDRDFVTDSGQDLYAVLKAKNLDAVLVMGVHTNMCVLRRSFAIKQLRRWDVPCYLVRDLTDAMYNPKMRPFVSHEDGTNLVIEYIERHWCPSVTSAELTGGR